jgi:YidC/Oxa1 family membrane protein insertase
MNRLKVTPLKLASSFRVPRRMAWLFALLLVVPLGATTGGCNPFAPQVTVADSPEQAFNDGAAKEKDAQSAADNRDKTEAQERWNNTANYYGAVARKFAGSENGLRALLEQTQAYRKAENNQSALSTIKSAVKQYAPGANQTPALREVYEQARVEEEDLIRAMDVQNSQTVYYKIMAFLVKICGGNDTVAPVLAIFLIAVLVMGLVWPFRVKQYRSAKEMQRYQPELEKLRAKYKNNPQELMAKQNEFFKTHGINQFAGCLPTLLSMPVTILMYQVILHYQFHFTQAHFMWVNPQAGEWASRLPWPLTGALAHHLGEPDLLLLVLYAASMFVQSKLMPVNSTDPAVVEQQKMMAVTMPAFFFVMMLQWQPASAFVLYWFVSNLLALGQQAIIYRTLPSYPPLVLSDTDGDMVSGGATNATGEKPLTANPKLVSPKNKRKK